MSTISNVAGRHTWLIIGGCSLLALYTTYRQLLDFKKRCALRSSDTRNVGVEQSTEDAIKLETLESLAKGVNPELRAAAHKIITERAMRASSMQYMIAKVAGEDQTERLMALKALNILTQHAPPSRFTETPGFFHTLVAALRTDETNPSKSSTRLQCERETVTILARFMTHAEAQSQIVAAGIVDWLKAYHVSGYPNVIIAAFDPDRRGDPLDPNFYDLLTAICDEGGYRDRILDSGMVSNIRRSRAEETPGEEWVEVEVEVPAPATALAAATAIMVAFEGMGS
ncbi:hypothetical protein EDC01DRAFT_778479 [Geopyxis carbonaria]|nr:hypothetical protein EDC01DRAFT_778479 [Geopyxis carbonaria]